MFGVVTRNVEELEWPEFSRGFYEVKDVTGRRESPVEIGVNMVSCHGDSNASQDSRLVPVTRDGKPATRDRKYFDWGYVCPTHAGYNDELLEFIADCASVNEDVRLDDVGFPRPEYCFCDRCTNRFEASDYDDRFEWRAAVITEFVTAARDVIPGRLFFTLYPDPYPGHLYQRAGLDLGSLEAVVDEFMIPLYDMAYSTTYWLEVLASGFDDALSTPFSIELYAVEVDVENLAHAADVAESYGKAVYFAYDADNARTVIHEMTSGGGGE